MNPKTIDLFTIALGLQKPWTCTNMEFDKEAGRLDLWIDFERGSRFECPECGRPQCTVHDTTDKEWRHLNFFQHQCYLHARVPRIKCDECGVHLSEVPWARPGSGFTLLFEAMALAMAEQMPMTEVSKLMEVFDTQLWRLVRHYVEHAREDTTAEYIHRVGVDETASSRGHRYVSVFVDMDTRRVVYATPGRDASTVESFVEDLVAHDGLPGQIESVCCDMSPAFIEGISKSLPEAGITFDRFHVMQLAGAAVDAVRREERKTNAALKRTRYVWLKNPSSLNHREQTLLESLSKQGLKDEGVPNSV